MGEFAVFAAGESGVFSSVRTGIEAGGRPAGSDGLQTFGGMRAVARYVKIVATPVAGGMISFKEARHTTIIIANTVLDLHEERLSTAFSNSLCSPHKRASTAASPLFRFGHILTTFWLFVSKSSEEIPSFRL